jgi:nicotinamide riboside kinase
MTNKQVIGLLGGPNTGKTELASSLYKNLSEQGLSVAWAREFSSYDLSKNGKPISEASFYEQYRYSFYQMRAEEEALKHADIVITDAPLLLGYVYPLIEKEKISDRRQKIFAQEFENLFRQDAARYTNLYLLRKSNFSDKKSLNYHTESEERLFNIILRNMLTCNNIQYTALPSSLELQTDLITLEIQKSHISGIINKNSDMIHQA